MKENDRTAKAPTTIFNILKLQDNGGPSWRRGCCRTRLMLVPDKASRYNVMSIRAIADLIGTSYE
jgi:hypothetical protein